MTVVSGKTLGNLIDLQMSTQQSLQKINAAMADSADKKESANQQILVDLTKKLLDVTMDNFKLNQKAIGKLKGFDDIKDSLKDVTSVWRDSRNILNQQADSLSGISKNFKEIKDTSKVQRKSLEDQNRIFDDLTKNMKNWKSVGDKLKDFKAGASDKMSFDNIKKSLLKGLNIGGILNEKLLALDFKKQAKLTGQAQGMSKKDLDKQAKEFASAMMTSQRENAKLQRLAKQTGRSEEDLQYTPLGKQILDKRNAAAAKADQLYNPGKQQDAADNKSSKDLSNKMGGNTIQGASNKDLKNKMGGNTGISVPLVSAEASKLTDLPSGASLENKNESARTQAMLADNIERIANNTDMMVNKDQQGNKKQDTSKKSALGGLGDFLGNIMDMLSSGFMKAIRVIFNPRNILKVIGKVFAPAMIIGSLFSGILDGFQAWKETGSISEALIAGVGGVLKFLTFGLFDKDTVKSVVDTVKGFVNSYIIEPLTNFVGGLGDMFDQYIANPIKNVFSTMMQWGQDLSDLLNDYVITPITTAIQPIKDFFSDMASSMLNWLKNFEIPGISFKVPMYGDVSFGPWHPFQGDDTKSADNVAAQAPTPTTGSKVSSASKDNADQQAIVEGQANKTPAASVNTAVQNNSSTTNVIKPSIRNQESSQSRYMSSRYA